MVRKYDIAGRAYTTSETRPTRADKSSALKQRVPACLITSGIFQPPGLGEPLIIHRRVFSDRSLAASSYRAGLVPVTPRLILGSSRSLATLANRLCWNERHLPLPSLCTIRKQDVRHLQCLDRRHPVNTRRKRKTCLSREQWPPVAMNLLFPGSP